MSRPVVVHGYLRKARETSADGLAWLERLPDLVAELSRRWGLEIAGTPYEGGMCGWVAPVRRAGDDAVLKITWPHPEATTEAAALRVWDGDDAVLKITWPHPEAATEAAALRVWDGAGAVRLLAEDSDAWAMLLERCTPGTPLRDAGLPNEGGLAIGAGLLNALWGKAVPTGELMPFDSMGLICDGWADSAERRAETYGAALRTLGTDPGILTLGIELLRSLPRSTERQVVVHGDFNPGNVLAARRAPFLAIDPKPMVGDPAYDPWPLVAQLDWPFRSANAAWVVSERIRRLADLLDLTPERIAAWGIARDVEGGLWAATDNNAADGAKWIRSATIIAPMLG